MPRPLPPDVARQLLARGGGATLAELHAWGLSMSSIRRLTDDGELIRSGRGRYALPVTGVADQWRRRRAEHLRCATALAPPDGILGLRTASLAWDVPVVSIPGKPEILGPPSSRQREGTRTIRCLVPPEDVTARFGVPVTSLERTAVDVALDLPTPEALVTVDAALRRGADREVMLLGLAARGPVRGCRTARRTLEWADGGSEAPLESQGRGELMMCGVPRPTCNTTVRLGEEACRPDDLWLPLGIVGEADGRGKYDEPDQTTLWAEKRRQEWMETELGLLVLRWTTPEVRWTPHELAHRWFRLAERRRAEPWSPPTGLTTDGGDG
jgi:hypothetical protein